jgi:hypothetical protein
MGSLAGAPVAASSQPAVNNKPASSVRREGERESMRTPAVDPLPV